MGYEPVVYSVNNLPETICLKLSYIQLEEVSVYPAHKLVKEIWKKYYQIYKAELKKSKKVREAEKNIFFYRQITQTDTVYNEFMECFFTGTNLYGVEDLQLKKGRYAKYEEDGLNLMTLTNFFYVSTIRPFYPDNPTRKTAINVFIQPNSEELFDIMVVRTIDGGKDGKILVFEFTPKENNPNKIMSGNLYVRSKDLAILRMECSLDIGLTSKDNEWNDIKTLSHTSEINYIDGIKDYPVVGNVKCTLHGLAVKDGTEYPFEVSSMFFLVDYPFEFGRSKASLKRDDFLLTEVRKMKYDPEFWRDNPVIKRTPVEDGIIKSFENKNIFGNFNPNEE